MQALTQRFLVILAFPVCIIGCTGLSHSWDGTWKLIPAKSQVPGVSFKIVIGDAGEYTIDYGAYVDRFRCDGREYQLISGKTISCRWSSARAFDSVARRNGILLNTAHWELGADEKTLSIKLTASQANGLAKTKTIVYERTAGTSGFAGAWRDVDLLEDRPQVLVLAVSGRHLHYGFPEVGQYADVEMNGAEAPWNGPSIPVGTTVAVTIQDHSELLVLRKLNGHVLNQGIMRISPDEHTLVEEFWSPDRLDVKSILVWKKQ